MKMVITIDDIPMMTFIKEHPDDEDVAVRVHMDERITDEMNDFLCEASELIDTAINRVIELAQDLPEVDTNAKPG